MNPIVEKLFDTYAESVLREMDNFPHISIQGLLDTLPLTSSQKVDLHDKFFNCYLQWSTDAFAIGLHLGLSLLHDDIRRPRPQQVQ